MRGLRKNFCVIFAGIIVLAALGALWLRHDFEKYRGSGSFVLEYHSIGTHPDWPEGMVIAPQVFERHLQYLRARGYEMVTVAELAERLQRGGEGEKLGRCIALSFDDGYLDNYTQALPLLCKYGARGTFAVINSKIGGKGYMDIRQLQELQRAGMEIASHTFSHNRLEDIAPLYLDWEIGVSKYDLEKRVLPPEVFVSTLAYPCGSYNAACVAKLEQFGYRAALTGNEFLNTPARFRAQPMEMCRLIVLDSGTNADAFEKLLQRGYWRSYLYDHGIDIRRWEEIF